jgi:hypothetical protein
MIANGAKALRAWAGQSRIHCDGPAAKGGRGWFNGCATAVLLACVAAACTTQRAAPARRDSRTFPAGRPGLMRLRGGHEDAADDEEIMCGGHGIEERTTDNFEVRVAGGARARACAICAPARGAPAANLDARSGRPCHPSVQLLCHTLLCACTSAIACVCSFKSRQTHVSTGARAAPAPPPIPIFAASQPQTGQADLSSVEAGGGRDRGGGGRAFHAV